MSEEKRSPGRPFTGNAKIKVTIRLPKVLVDLIDGEGDRTLVITKILKSYYKEEQ